MIFEDVSRMVTLISNPSPNATWYDQTIHKNQPRASFNGTARVGYFKLMKTLHELSVGTIDEECQAKGKGTKEDED